MTSTTPTPNPIHHKDTNTSPTSSHNDDVVLKAKMVSENYDVVPLVHHTQHRQLCAIHAMNNLLQLSSSSCTNYDDNGNDGTDKSMILINGCVYHSSSISSSISISSSNNNTDGNMQIDIDSNAGTKQEFDQLADILSSKEDQLLMMDGMDDNNNCDDSGGQSKISFWRSIRSHHRTPITGNYSLEVLQTALSKRNVELEWYSTSTSTSNNNSTETSQDNNKVIIGYIINEKQPPSIFAPHLFLFHSYHWYAITRLRRVSSTNTNNENSGNSGNGRGGNANDDANNITSNASSLDMKTVDNNRNNNENISSSSSSDLNNYSNQKWHVIDSQRRMNDIRDLNSNDELEIFLKQIARDGGTILQATTLATAATTTTSSDTLM